MTEVSLFSLCKSSLPATFTPQIIGSFAVSGTRKWIENAKPYLQLYEPEYWTNNRLRDNPLDLKEGKLIIGEDEFFNQGIHAILEWKLRHPDLPRPDFVCTRGSLSKLLCTPYERKEPWSLTSIYHEGTIYIKVEETDYARNRGEIFSSMCHVAEWGFKFEQLLTQGSQKKKSFWSTNQNYYSVFNGVIDNMNILYSAKVDAALHSKEFVEIKLAMKNYDEDSNTFYFKRKSLNWWSQSYLAGINTIVCGLRDDNGVVREIVNFDVKNISKWKECDWSEDTCIESLRYILKSIKSEIVEQGVVYNISYCPLKKVVSGRPTNLNSDHILPYWYTKSCSKS